MYKSVPPVGAEYQRTAFPFIPEAAVNTTAPVPHRLDPVPLAMPGIGLTVAVMPNLLVATLNVVLLYEAA